MIAIKLKSAIEAYKIRTGDKITYTQLSEATGLSVTTLQSLGSRSSYNTTLKTIDLICSTLKCEISDLLEFVPSKDGADIEG